MQVIIGSIFALIGYHISNLISKPESRVNKKLPRIKIKNIELLPSLKIEIKGRIIHFHHWFNFTILLCISIFVTDSFLSSWIARGFLIGGTFQGLRFPDRNIFQINRKS